MKLSKDEWREYSNLVYQFVKAKQVKDYDKSDRLREELKYWQRGTSDQIYEDMVKTGKYVFHTHFEGTRYESAQAIPVSMASSPSR